MDEDLDSPDVIVGSIRKLVKSAFRNVKWNPALHPRGADGRFIKKATSVDVYNVPRGKIGGLRGIPVGSRVARPNSAEDRDFRGAGNTIVSVKMLQAGKLGNDTINVGDIIEVPETQIRQPVSAKAIRVIRPEASMEVAPLDAPVIKPRATRDGSPLPVDPTSAPSTARKPTRAVDEFNQTATPTKRVRSAAEAGGFRDILGSSQIEDLGQITEREAEFIVDNTPDLFDADSNLNYGALQREVARVRDNPGPFSNLRWLNAGDDEVINAANSALSSLRGTPQSATREQQAVIAESLRRSGAARSDRFNVFDSQGKLANPVDDPRFAELNDANLQALFQVKNAGRLQPDWTLSIQDNAGNNLNYPDVEIKEGLRSNRWRFDNAYITPFERPTVDPTSGSLALSPRDLLRAADRGYADYPLSDGTVLRVNTTPAIAARTFDNVSGISDSSIAEVSGKLAGRIDTSVFSQLDVPNEVRRAYHDGYNKPDLATDYLSERWTDATPGLIDDLDEIKRNEAVDRLLEYGTPRGLDSAQYRGILNQAGYPADELSEFDREKFRAAGVPLDATPDAAPAPNARQAPDVYDLADSSTSPTTRPISPEDFESINRYNPLSDGGTPPNPAVSSYVGFGYQDINSSLRDVDGRLDSIEDSDIASDIRDIDGQMSPMPNDVVLSRGVSLRRLFQEGAEGAAYADDQDLDVESLVGREFIQRGYTSASATTVPPAAFLGTSKTSPKAMLWIRVPKGTPALSISGDEREVVLGRNAKYKVLGVSKVKALVNGEPREFPLIDAEVVPDVPSSQSIARKVTPDVADTPRVDEPATGDVVRRADAPSTANQDLGRVDGGDLGSPGGSATPDVTPGPITDEPSVPAVRRVVADDIVIDHASQVDDMWKNAQTLDGGLDELITGESTYDQLDLDLKTALDNYKSAKTAADATRSRLNELADSGSATANGRPLSKRELSADEASLRDTSLGSNRLARQLEDWLQQEEAASDAGGPTPASLNNTRLALRDTIDQTFVSPEDAVNESLAEFRQADAAISPFATDAPSPRRTVSRSSGSGGSKPPVSRPASVPDPGEDPLANEINKQEEIKRINSMLEDAYAEFVPDRVIRPEFNDVAAIDTQAGESADDFRWAGIVSDLISNFGYNVDTLPNEVRQFMSSNDILPTNIDPQKVVRASRSGDLVDESGEILPDFADDVIESVSRIPDPSARSKLTNIARNAGKNARFNPEAIRREMQKVLDSDDHDVAQDRLAAVMAKLQINNGNQRRRFRKLLDDHFGATGNRIDQEIAVKRGGAGRPTARPADPDRPMPDNYFGDDVPAAIAAMRVADAKRIALLGWEPSGEGGVRHYTSPNGQWRMTFDREGRVSVFNKAFAAGQPWQRVLRSNPDDELSQIFDGESIKTSGGNTHVTRSIPGEFFDPGVPAAAVRSLNEEASFLKTHGWSESTTPEGHLGYRKMLDGVEHGFAITKDGSIIGLRKNNATDKWTVLGKGSVGRGIKAAVPGPVLDQIIDDGPSKYGDKAPFVGSPEDLRKYYDRVGSGALAEGFVLGTPRSLEVLASNRKDLTVDWDRSAKTSLTRPNVIARISRSGLAEPPPFNPGDFATPDATGSSVAPTSVLFGLRRGASKEWMPERPIAGDDISRWAPEIDRNLGEGSALKFKPTISRTWGMAELRNPATIGMRRSGGFLEVTDMDKAQTELRKVFALEAARAQDPNLLSEDRQRALTRAMQARNMLRDIERGQLIAQSPDFDSGKMDDAPDALLGAARDALVRADALGVDPGFWLDGNSIKISDAKSTRQALRSARSNMIDESKLGDNWQSDEVLARNIELLNQIDRGVSNLQPGVDLFPNPNPFKPRLTPGVVRSAAARVVDIDTTESDRIADSLPESGMADLMFRNGPGRQSLTELVSAARGVGDDIGMDYPDGNFIRIHDRRAAYKSLSQAAAIADVVRKNESVDLPARQKANSDWATFNSVAESVRRGGLDETELKRLEEVNAVLVAERIPKAKRKVNGPKRSNSGYGGGRGGIGAGRVDLSNTGAQVGDAKPNNTLDSERLARGKIFDSNRVDLVRALTALNDDVETARVGAVSDQFVPPTGSGATFRDAVNRIKKNELNQLVSNSADPGDVKTAVDYHIGFGEDQLGRVRRIQEASSRASKAKEFLSRVTRDASGRAILQDVGGGSRAITDEPINSQQAIIDKAKSEIAQETADFKKAAREYEPDFGRSDAIEPSGVFQDASSIPKLRVIDPGNTGAPLPKRASRTTPSNPPPADVEAAARRTNAARALEEARSRAAKLGAPSDPEALDSPDDAIRQAELNKIQAAKKLAQAVRDAETVQATESISELTRDSNSAESTWRRALSDFAEFTQAKPTRMSLPDFDEDADNDVARQLQDNLKLAKTHFDSVKTELDKAKLALNKVTNARKPVGQIETDSSNYKALRSVHDQEADPGFGFNLDDPYSWEVYDYAKAAKSFENAARLARAQRRASKSVGDKQSALEREQFLSDMSKKLTREAQSAPTPSTSDARGTGNADLDKGLDAGNETRRKVVAAAMNESAITGVPSGLRYSEGRDKIFLDGDPDIALEWLSKRRSALRNIEADKALTADQRLSSFREGAAIDALTKEIKRFTSPSVPTPEDVVESIDDGSGARIPMRNATMRDILSAAQAAASAGNDVGLASTKRSVLGDSFGNSDIFLTDPDKALSWLKDRLKKERDLLKTATRAKPAAEAKAALDDVNKQIAKVETDEFADEDDRKQLLSRLIAQRTKLTSNDGPKHSQNITALRAMIDDIEGFQGGRQFGRLPAGVSKIATTSTDAKRTSFKLPIPDNDTLLLAQAAGTASRIGGTATGIRISNSANSPGSFVNSNLIITDPGAAKTWLGQRLKLARGVLDNPTATAAQKARAAGEIRAIRTTLSAIDSKLNLGKTTGLRQKAAARRSGAFGGSDRGGPKATSLLNQVGQMSIAKKSGERFDNGFNWNLGGLEGLGGFNADPSQLAQSPDAGAAESGTDTRSGAESGGSESGSGATVPSGAAAATESGTNSTEDDNETEQVLADGTRVRRRTSTRAGGTTLTTTTIRPDGSTTNSSTFVPRGNSSTQVPQGYSADENVIPNSPRVDRNDADGDGINDEVDPIDNDIARDADQTAANGAVAARRIRGFDIEFMTAGGEIPDPQPRVAGVAINAIARNPENPGLLIRPDLSIQVTDVAAARRTMQSQREYEVRVERDIDDGELRRDAASNIRAIDALLAAFDILEPYFTISPVTASIMLKYGLEVPAGV